MSVPEKPLSYRQMIDELVRVCHDGQGQVGPRRVRAGIWNQNATAESIPEQHQINLLLQRLSAADREILAGMLSHAAETGVFETLKVLEEFEVEPFQNGYEGTPYHDFIGRLGGWQWPVA